MYVVIQNTRNILDVNSILWKGGGGGGGGGAGGGGGGAESVLPPASF